MNPSDLFGLSDHLEALSKHGDPLEVLDATVDFEYFRGWLVDGLGYADGSKGGRPPFDPVSMFKAQILQAQHNLSDARRHQRRPPMGANYVSFVGGEHIDAGLGRQCVPTQK